MFMIDDLFFPSNDWHAMRLACRFSIDENTLDQRRSPALGYRQTWIAGWGRVRIDVALIESVFLRLSNGSRVRFYWLHRFHH